MARAPPAARMSLDARFHDCDPSIKFDGANFEDFQFALFTALSACPAAAAILTGDLTRPLPADARHLLLTKSGVNLLAAFKAGTITFSTGAIAISIPPSDAQYATVCSVGIYNSPWQGDTFTLAVAHEDYTAFERDRKAALVATGQSADN